MPQSPDGRPARGSYDYIFAGAGCAALSLLVRMLQSGRFTQKKILLLDKAAKDQNDRTWCFWEKQPGYFEDIVYKSWDRLRFRSEGFSTIKETAPYQYKMIRGIDFYRYCFDIIRQYPLVEIAYEPVKAIEQHEPSHVQVRTPEHRYTAPMVFSSIVPPVSKLPRNDYYLLQHFAGWRIKTSKPAFDPAEATLMDFRVTQEQGTTFVYVMPFSATDALVEYTLFSKAVLDKEVYETGLRDYIEKVLGVESYTIEEREFGIIPMTNRVFPPRKGNLVYLGTAGGQTKASTGYTFQFIQKQAQSILDQLDAAGFSKLSSTNNRFNFYDSVLLRLLAMNQLSGKEIFTRLFKRNEAPRIFRFLDNETSIKEELQLISTLQTIPFLKAAIHHLV